MSKEMNEKAVVVLARGVNKRYSDGVEDVHVLDDVNLAVEKGEVVAIVGSSGSGKSTLLHVLGGLDLFDAGEVVIDGVSLQGLSSNERAKLRNASLGFVYQFHHLLPEFSALDNVAMPLWIRREDRDVATEKARTMLEAVGLGHRMTHLPSQLSGGERQRVAIARAMVTNPACILADEPTGNLDRRTSDAVFQRFVDLAHSSGTAILIVTHDESLAARCDRAVRLEQGKIVPLTFA